ncbi:uncharacterized protein LOC129756320 [Uranotaenia lowii]|uniref:uncharacterized protein LOC129756320 n=1 Tax=Uranotaenia lowii TaxID=190385 RepID=UPI00247A88E1|nr:uncharacterized protein LOC129756320 [Uranotaenia lowii]
MTGKYKLFFGAFPLRDEILIPSCFNIPDSGPYHFYTHQPNMNIFDSSGFSAPGRNASGFSETSEPIDSVALFPASGISRPGPEFDSGDEVLQPATTGKYKLFFGTLPLRDKILNPSCSKMPDLDPYRFDKHQPNENIFDSSGFSTPGRIVSGLSETSEPFDSVALFPASGISRPGPEFDCGDEVLQPAPTGKYKFSFGTFPPRDTLSVSSRANSADSNQYYFCNLPPNENIANHSGVSAPGRNELGTLETPEPFDSVALIPASVISRPGPEFVCGEGVLQPVNSGKYSTPDRIPVPDDVLPSSARFFKPAPGPLDSVTLYYQNVGGINSCLTDYLLATSCSCYDIIAFTETWLNDRTLSSQIFCPDYAVFRCDRSSRNSKKSSGGGVLLAVKSNLPAQLIVEVSSFCAPEDDLLVIGDFNMPGLKWCSHHGSSLYADPACSTFSAPSNIILDSLSTATLRQINGVVNEYGRTLDLCFANDGSRLPFIELAPAPLVKVVPHHHPQTSDLLPRLQKRQLR